MVDGEGERYEDTPLAVRCFALMVLGHDYAKKSKTEASPDETDERSKLTESAIELFNKRKDFSDEGSSWLALGMHYLHILPKERALLLNEITRPVKATDFDPVTFGSKTRAEAISLFAQCEIASTNWSDAKRRPSVMLWRKLPNPRSTHRRRKIFGCWWSSMHCSAAIFLRRSTLAG